MIESEEVLALIPARGGSKSIPRKNLRQIAGHPLVAWSIETALRSKSVGRVVVSTDDPEIAEIAAAYGAEVPFLRPREIALDDTLDLPVFQHALEWLETNEDYRPYVVVQLRPTSPLRPAGLVDRAVDMLSSDPRADSVRTVTPPAQNPFKMWRIQNGLLEPLLESGLREPFNLPRQVLPPTVWQTGQLDAVRRETLEKKLSLTGDRILALLVDPECAVDIDDLIGWQIAEQKLLSDDAACFPRRRAPSPLSKVRLMVFDFDGVFTDNRVHVSQDGSETVTCDRSDGMGIALLRENDIEAAVLSSETNPVVAARCAKLKIPLRQGLDDKSGALRELAREHGLALDELAFVGNDVNDLGCLSLVLASMVPADAHPRVKSTVAFVLVHRGGSGAVREACELVIRARTRPKEDRWR